MLERIDQKFPGLRKKILSRLIFKINPNIISFLALLTAVIAGICFYNSYFLIGSLFVLLNGILDILDGGIAKKYGTSKLGDFLDHTFDRLADAFILLGFALNPRISGEIAFIAIIMILLVSYLGTQAQAITGYRLYQGFLGRADRLVILIIIGIIGEFYSMWIVYGLFIILILSGLTFIERFYMIYRRLK